MVNKLVVASLSLLLLTITLGGCIEINTPPVQPATSSEPTVSTTTSPSPGSGPQYNTITFELDEDNEDFTFPVYVGNDETLHLLWRVKDEQNRVWFHILTPTGRSFGFYEDSINHTITLKEDFCQGFTGGITQFCPSERGWGEGYYTMHVTSYWQEPLTVTAEWWVGG